MRFDPRRLEALLFVCLFLGLPFSASADIIDLPMDFSPGMLPLEKYEYGKMSYEDPSISVTRESDKSREFDCTYYLLRIKIANPTQIRTITADEDGGFNTRAKLPVQDLSKRVKAVAAINGDYFTDHPGSFVLRQGVIFRETVNENKDILLIDEDGDLHIILAEENPGQMDLTQIDGKKVMNGFEFGPALIRDGQRVVNPDKSPAKSDPNGVAQRMAICQTGKLEYMLICVSRWGCTISDFADLILSFGDVQTAYTLDGGNSSQLVFLHNKINYSNTENDDPRPVPDIVYFASAYKPD